MRIGIDIRKVYDSGIGTYIRNLLDEFKRDEYPHTFFLFAAPADIERLRQDGIGQTSKFEIVASNAGKYSLGEIWGLGRAANKLNLDVYHTPHFTMPFGLKARKVVTIHDLIPLHLPEYFPPHKRVYARFMIGHACRSADVIMTDSHFTKGDICADFSVAPERVRVAHLGASPGFRLLEPEARAAFREKYNLQGRYAFYAGNFKPHKNIRLAIEALAQVPADAVEHLVLAGGSADELPELQLLASSLGVAARVKFLGKVPFADLVAAYNEAFVVTLPSRYEGFGLPVLEAMACGAPVVCADATSLPEVAGDAALLFPPNDATLLAKHMTQLAADPILRNDLIERGFARLKHFSAAATARHTMDAYQGLPYREA